MPGIDGIYQVVLNLCRNLCSWSLYVLGEEFNVLDVFDAVELIADLVLPVGYHVVQCLYVFLWQGEYYLCLEWDGIAHVAALP